MTVVRDPDPASPPSPGGPRRIPPIEGPIRLGVLLSGGGRTLQNLLDGIAGDSLPAVVSRVVASRSTARGVTRARDAGLETEVLRPRDFTSPRAYGLAIAAALEEAEVDLAVMAGFLAYWVVPEAWLGHVMNIHPALLPSFGGKGFYGEHVHEAAWARGVKVSGCTVHFADNEYDAGPIILQRAVDVGNATGPEVIASRVFEEECRAYPEAIRLYREGRLRLVGPRVAILDRPPAPPSGR